MWVAHGELTYTQSYDSEMFTQTLSRTVIILHVIPAFFSSDDALGVVSN